MAEAETSAHVTWAAPPSAAFNPKDPVWVKQSQDILILSNPPNCLPVILLIQKESGFLSVLHIHLVTHTVFHNFDQR